MGNKRTRLWKYDRIKETKKRDTTPTQEQPIDDEEIDLSQSRSFFYGMENMMEMDEDSLSMRFQLKI